jgi:transposase
MSYMTQDVWIGLDYGEETTAVCAIDAKGSTLLESLADSDAQAIAAVVQRLDEKNIRSVIIEGAVTSHFARQLLACGLPLVVVDAQKASKILSFYRNKTDANDARGLAEIGRLGAAPRMPAHLRSPECGAIRDQLIVRDQMVREAARLRHSLRSLLRRQGSRIRTLPRGRTLRPIVEDELALIQAAGGVKMRELIMPLVEVHEGIIKFVKAADRQLKSKAEELPATRSFLQIPGVGYLAALAFYSVIEDPARFARSEDVGAFLGLVPRVKQSGAVTRRSGITKGGDRLTRKSLVMSGWVMISRAKKDCALKDWARTLAERSGHYTARVALARKLSVVMLSMWKREATFDPYPSAPRA